MRREPNKTRTKEGRRGGKLHGRIILQKPGENDKPLVLYLHAGYSKPHWYNKKFFSPPSPLPRSVGS